MKRFAPAAERNCQAIAEVLGRELPEGGTALETASGTGQHIAYFARRFSGLKWQPSDMSPVALASIRAWRDESGLDNLLPPIFLDVLGSPWPLESLVGTGVSVGDDSPAAPGSSPHPGTGSRSGVAGEPASLDVVININMIHISPWECCQALLRGAGRYLVPGGLLFLYGPYRVRDRPTAPSNEAFDASLRAQDPAWGVRNLEDVVAEARGHGFSHESTHDMPANNLSVIFRRQPES